MTPLARTLAVVLVLACFAGTSEARTPAAKAAAIIAASKRATGGAAWDRPQGCDETGQHGTTAYRTRFSLRGYGMRTDSGTDRAMGFNGGARWQTAGGRVDIRSDPASLEEGITSTYLSVNGFFFPDRFPAEFTYLRAAKDGDGRFDVIEITPRGGRPLEVWFDARTHLIRRVVDTRGSPPVRVEASDYRRHDGLTVAYRLAVSGPDGAVANRGALTSFRCGPIEPGLFDPPPAR